MSYIPSNMQLKLLPDGSADELERKDWKEIRRGRLINSLNRINFNDEEIALTFKHRKYDRILTLSAKPQPCRPLSRHAVFRSSRQIPPIYG